MNTLQIQLVKYQRRQLNEWKKVNDSTQLITINIISKAFAQSSIAIAALSPKIHNSVERWHRAYSAFPSNQCGSYRYDKMKTILKLNNKWLDDQQIGENITNAG